MAENKHQDFLTRYLGKPCFYFIVALLMLHYVIPENPGSSNTLPVAASHDVEQSREWFLPLKTPDRQNWNTVYLEHDAHFLAWRRTNNPRRPRRHTGIDIQNIGSHGGPGEPIYAMSVGKVVGIFEKHPNQRILIEHKLEDGRKVWSCYIHITAPRVRPGQRVDATSIIAHRLNYGDLNHYGWEYNHVHIEILKELPRRAHGKYKWMSARSYSINQVQRYFYNPKEFLQQMWQKYPL